MGVSENAVLIVMPTVPKGSVPEAQDAVVEYEMNDA
jgi:hypothetical protein